MAKRNEEELKIQVEHNRQVWEQMDYDTRQIFLGGNPAFELNDKEFTPKKDYFIQRFIDDKKPISENPFAKNKFEKLLEDMQGGFEYDIPDDESVGEFGGGECDQVECKKCNKES